MDHRERVPCLASSERHQHLAPKETYDSVKPGTFVRTVNLLR